MQPPVRTIIRGVEYPSMAAAARALGVNRVAVWQAAERGTLNRVGFGDKVPVIIDGITYPSLSEAARALGITHQSVSSRVRWGTAQRAQEAAA
jgi:hypothetical protein